MHQNWAIIKSVAVLLFLSIAQLASAQSFPVFEDNNAIATVDQEALFTRSEAGRAFLSKFETAGKELSAENLKIQDRLEKEERALTETRKTMPPEEFKKLAIAFDQNVKRIRSEQAAKERDLNLQLTRDRSSFYDKITPILLAFMQERGIEILLNKETIIIATHGSDITQAAIQRINEVLN